MSTLYRSERWLTLDRLVPAWARELVNATTSASECERDLWHSLQEDIINGGFDKGKVWGLAFIQPNNRALPVKGRLLFGKTSLPLVRYSHRILVNKNAVLDFAERKELSRPSWWVDRLGASKEDPPDVRLVTPAVPTARKPRRGPEPGSVDRFGDLDQALFPELERIMSELRMSVHGAARKLALEEKVDGVGSQASRAKRLASRYLKARTATR